MIRNFRLVKVDYKYCDYLRKFDRVSYNAGIKELRPFIGVLFIVNGCKYFAPLSSPKPKHLNMKNNIDLIKIDNGNLGVINLNNMIPVREKNYEIFDLNKKTKDINELKRHMLLKNQLKWLNNHRDIVKDKALKLYDLYVNNRLPKRISVKML